MYVENDIETMIENCPSLKKCLEREEPVDMMSFPNVVDYLEFKRDAIQDHTFSETDTISSVFSRVQELKSSRFKGSKRIVDSFYITDVKKIVLLTYSNKNEIGRFSCLWLE